ncbi:hypothetical protein NPX13_g4835 [Xylaria arbuscula]|uniref:F-box domain-containing protein n=1 Tax=Xylaria arbuscula TaxID=114810 RepID=A0A9W8NES4_9PEZI|nr:hypothetical protein NPX13_g4835 [Xylaria arbuscula]
MPLNLPVEIFRLVCEALLDDTESLATVGLVSREWRTASLPVLLSQVDLSSHNKGRLPEHEDDYFPLEGGIVMADYSDAYRPRNLVTRQRAFLRLIIDRPELAIYVRTFAWTLVWLDFDDDDLSDVDLRTWDVFSLLRNVTHLDLASLHAIGCDEPYIRQNPARLFPAVTHLRLVGWMHRGLVKAIISSLDAAQLVSLDLHYLQEEGSLPNGEPMPSDVARKYARSYRHGYSQDGIDDELWARQEHGDACIFPGPMWLPLRFLRQRRPSSLAHFRIRIMPEIHTLDRRNYNTMFQETAKFIRSTKNTMRSISIGLGEKPIYFCEDKELDRMCGTARTRIKGAFRWLTSDISANFLHSVLAALTEEQYPRLTQVEFVGFRILKTGTSQRIPPNLTREYIRDCPFVDDALMENANLDCRRGFGGHDHNLPNMDQHELDRLTEILRRS